MFLLYDTMRFHRLFLLPSSSYSRHRCSNLVNSEINDLHRVSQSLLVSLYCFCHNVSLRSSQNGNLHYDQPCPPSSSSLHMIIHPKIVILSIIYIINLQLSFLIFSKQCLLYQHRAAHLHQLPLLSIDFCTY